MKYKARMTKISHNLGAQVRSSLTTPPTGSKDTEKATPTKIGQTAEV